MKVGNTPYRTIWLADDGWTVEIIDQTGLPHEFRTVQLTGLDDVARAIATMEVRGAPLIGATAAYGVCLALREDATDQGLKKACDVLRATRPTAVNLAWALAEMEKTIIKCPVNERVEAAYRRAAEICDEDVEMCRSIGEHGKTLISDAALAKGDGPVNILTHCNAGWLATVDWGTALAPVYMAHDAGIGVHVWVDETRPRNQGASLTAWELGAHGVPHTVIADNAGGHLMQKGAVDLCITGTDRTARNGDVCNKIGTYLKALAAFDNNVPFYVGLPGPTIDWDMACGMDIPIEERDGAEVTHIQGVDDAGVILKLRLTPDGTSAANPAFDISPAHLVAGLITERGVCAASDVGLAALYPERVGP